MEMAAPGQGHSGNRLALAFGLALLAIGVCVAVVGANYDITGERDYDVDWESVAVFGVFLVAAGIGFVVNAMLGADIPLWRIQEGARSRNPGAVAMVCLGATAGSFEGGFLTMTALLDVSTELVGIHIVVALVSAALIAVGYVARPRWLFGMDGFEETSRRSRLAVGFTLIASGIVLQIAGLVFGGDGGELVDTVYVIWMFVIGLILEVAGAGSIRPQGRPWVESGSLD